MKEDGWVGRWFVVLEVRDSLGWGDKAEAREFRFSCFSGIILRFF